MSESISNSFGIINSPQSGKLPLFEDSKSESSCSKEQEESNPYNRNKTDKLCILYVSYFRWLLRIDK